MANVGRGGSPDSAVRISRPGGSVEGSAAVTARSVCTVASMASTLPISATDRQTMPLSRKALKTDGRNAQFSQPSDTGKGRFE